MKKQLEIKHNLLNINYQHFNFQEIVNFKKDTLHILRYVEQIENLKNEEGLINQFKGFKEVTDGVFGVASNPYSNVIRDIRELVWTLSDILDYMKEWWVLDMIDFINKPKQTFNLCPQLNRDLDKFIKTVKKFDAAIELYNEAYLDRENIFKKYIGFKDDSKDMFFRAHNNDYKVITPEGNYLCITTYYFNGWDVGKFNPTLNKDFNGIYKDIFEILYPQYFI